MTVEKVYAFRTSDGSFFIDKHVAEAYENSDQFVTWCEEHLRKDWDGHACAIFILQFWNVSMK